jgi:hypothetical protein
MKSILGEKHELQIITGNVVTGTNDSFTLATDEGQTYGVSTTNNFSVDFSQRVTVAWSKERESIVEPKLIFLYNHDTKNKQYTLPLDLQENRLKLSIKSLILSFFLFFLILIIGNFLFLFLFFLIRQPINLIFSSECVGAIIVIIRWIFTLFLAVLLVVIFVRKSIKSYQQSNETYFWLTKTLENFIGESKPAEKQNFQKFRSRILSRYWRLIKWCLYFAKEVLEYSGKTAQEQINLVIVSNSLPITMLLGMLQLMVVIMVLSIALSPLALVLFPVWLPILAIAKLPGQINSLGQYLSVCFPQ